MTKEILRKKKILWLSDHPLVPSGVGIQARYVIEGLLRTKEFSFFCLGGAIKHPDYRPQVVSPELYGDDGWIIQPVDGHGSKDQLRRCLKEQRPDVIVLFTDPRFFTWVWEMEDEVRAQCPIIYWHVWDNDPIPTFNKAMYESNDHLIALSLKTYGVFQGLGIGPDRCSYVPHSVPSEVFRPLPDDEVRRFRAEHYGHFANREFIVMWNNRNARRKMVGDVMRSFALLSNKVGRDRVALFMHTAPDDQEGQDINSVAKLLGIDDQLMLSSGRVSADDLNVMYNCADCTVNISNNEGFGVGTLESLSAGTPIVVNMTGGLQFQVGDWWHDVKDFSDQARLERIARSRLNNHQWWGLPVFPATRNLVGSQQVPFIYDDRVDDFDVADAMKKLFTMGRKKRRALGLKAREWVHQNFSMDLMISSWKSIIERTIESHKEKRGTMNFSTIRI